jgi:hypothetical protein
MGGLWKESTSFERALWGGLLLGDPEESGKKGSGNGYVRFTGNSERYLRVKSRPYSGVYTWVPFLDPEDDRELILGALALW